MKTLIITVGLPRSGKSTWAKQQRAPAINRDSIRLALHGERFLLKAEPWVTTITDTMIDSFFLYGQYEHLIIDECNVTKKRRERWLAPDRETLFVVFNTPYEVCRQRALTSLDFEILPVIDRMAEEWEDVELDDETAVMDIFHDNTRSNS